MAFLASKELDDVEEKHGSQAPPSLSSFLLPHAQTWLLGAIIRLWPLGLVLANAAVGARGFQRKLVAWACLQLPSSSPSSHTIQKAQEQAGVTSIRALPQVSCVVGWMAVLPTTAVGPSHPTTGGQSLEVHSRRSTEAETRAVLTLLESQKPELPHWLRVWISSVITTRNFPEPFHHF